MTTVKGVCLSDSFILNKHHYFLNQKSAQKAVYKKHLTLWTMLSKQLHS